MRHYQKIILSLGGNVIIRRGERGEIEEQFGNARRAVEFIARSSLSGASVIITHGNGPVVGNILIRNEAVRNIIPPMPLYICGADSEGGIGFMLQQSLYNQLKKAGVRKHVVTVVTQSVVRKDDPAFEKPAKPIGPYYTKEEAGEISAREAVHMMEDSGRGYRRVVPSPRPISIVEAPVIKMLSEAGVIVIAAGGGGVPVVEEGGGTLRAVNAVIDKDFATSLLGLETGSETFINLTQIDMAYLNFNKPGQKGIREMDVKEAKRHLRAGEFAPGSMGPKIEAAIEFLEGGGKEVFITTPELLEEALQGRAGTRIFQGCL